MRIPAGNFGNQIPQGTQRQGAPLRSFVNTDGAQQVGAQLQNVGDQLYMQEKQRQDEADRVASITAQAKAKNALADLHDDISRGLQDGSYDKTKVGQKYLDDSNTIVEDALKNVRGEHQELVRAALQDDIGRYRRGVGHLVDQRNQSDIRGGIMAYGEEMSRYAQRGDAEFGEAVRNYGAFLDSAGPQAGMTAADIQRARQGFNEQATYTKGYSLVGKAGDSIANLRAVQKRIGSDEFANMDPQRRAALDSTLTSKIATLENRAVIQQQAALNRAQATYTEFNEFTAGGRMPTDAYLQEVITKTKGTPFEAAVMEQIKQGPASAGFATMPVQQQAVQLQGLAAKLNQEGSNPALEKQYRQLEQIHKQSVADLKEDPMTAALERNVLKDIKPLDLSDIRTLPQQLAVRAQSAAVVDAYAGRTVAPITKNEATQIAALLDNLGPKEKAAALIGLKTAVGSTRLSAIGSMMNDKDPTFAIGAGLASVQSNQGRNVAELYFSGKRALSEGRVKIDSEKGTGTKATAYTQLAGVYATPKATDQAAEAVLGVYANFRAEGVGESRAMSQAVNLVTGGVLENYNGGKVALPYGKTKTDFVDAVNAITPEMLAAQSKAFRVGGKELSPQDLAAQLPKLQLQTVGSGVYAVKAASVPVTKADGSLLVLDLNTNAAVPQTAGYRPNYGYRETAQGQ